MQYIVYNASFDAILTVAGSTNTDTVSYAIYTHSGTSFATGTPTFVAGTAWKITFTPTINNETYIVVLTDTTTGTTATETYKATGVIGTTWDATSGAVGSSVGIANIALSKIGAQRITSFSESTETARLLNAIYGTMRDEVLRAHPWNFAIKRIAPALSATTPAYEYTYQHTIPSDCLRVLDVTDGSTRIEDFKVEDGKILSDYDTIYIRYIYRVTDSTAFDANFISCFATRLAAECAFPLTGKADLGQALKVDYTEQLRLAKSIDGQESGIIDETGKDTFIEARY